MTRNAVALPVAALLAACWAAPAADYSEVRGIRSWNLGDVTRIAVEVTGEFAYRHERLHNPDRIFFDLTGSRPNFSGKRLYQGPLEGKLATQVRVAETRPGVTRIVLDLDVPADYTVRQLANPPRLMIEVRAGAPLPIEPLPSGVTQAVPKPTAKRALRTFIPPAVPEPPPAEMNPILTQYPVLTPTRVYPHDQPQPSLASLPRRPGPAPVARSQTAVVRLPDPPAAVKLPAAPPAPVSGGASSARGASTLTRALGLKVNRVVIDAGHGGHDTGTIGPRGLNEKDLVLDVALRVGKLVEDKLGAEVVYTRRDDTFVPLERRTQIANEARADLFLSIHANSSSSPRIAGVETFYLSMTNQSDALAVAARENAAANMSVFELQDTIKKIAMQEKVDESRAFAGHIQNALHPVVARNNPGIRNRGVKKAPFVVLIGARMPSILAEISFLSNPKEEALLKKADHRQKLADALFKGLSRYANDLSHFQVAAARD